MRTTHHNQRTTLTRTKLSRTNTVQMLFIETKAMDKTNFFNDLQNKISQALENSPAKDIEKNVKAMLNQGFARMDLVTREEFEVQTQVLAKTRAKLEALEARVAELEAQLKNK